MFGDPRNGAQMMLGAAQRPSADRHQLKAWSDDEILRDRDPLEQQTTCWACEGWERVELRWSTQNDENMPRAVWAFTNLDNFRNPLRLHLDADGHHFVGSRVVPP